MCGMRYFFWGGGELVDRLSQMNRLIEKDHYESMLWKDGLRLKLKKCGITGNMYQWISQYLDNRSARVHINGFYSRKKTLKERIPKGGVLSPTLFLIFINNIMNDMSSTLIS